eukprot:TRINITY_DN6513_c0_g1_i3.p1 TRINITY_DN6513_c0_g1~~TRINITY_DN6513_c0_g1_i3.p1  ORF type:complete len:513 (+),score=81.55 TRINITY_DN6513_c0_g1_i3:193-1539(+)
MAKILRDTTEVNQLKQNADREMVAELYYRIAQGYLHTPDLRQTWLMGLATFHGKEKNYVEAGLCHFRVANLIYQYLKNALNYAEVIPEEVFRAVDPSEPEVVEEGEEWSCQSHSFSEAGLLIELRVAIEYFEKAHHYHFACGAYKILALVQAHKNDYAELASCHKQLEKYYNLLAKPGAAGKTNYEFFRVLFLGTPLGALAGKQYIYKAKPFTHLFDFANQMKEMVSKGYSCPVEVIDASIDTASLKPKIAYLQITFLRPYFKRGVAESGVNLVHFFSFIYQTPFTKSEGSRSESVADQYKRKTILTLEKPLPNILRRVQVKEVKEIELNPLEVSIEEITERSIALKKELNKSPVDIKTLQQILQGSALPQVNEGAIKICQIFLKSEEGERYQPEHLQLLQDALREFLEACQAALMKNKTLIKADQMAFQAELENGFAQLKSDMEKYL